MGERMPMDDRGPACSPMRGRDGGLGENAPFECPLTGRQIDRHNFLQHYEQELRRCLANDLGPSLEGWLEDELKALTVRGAKGGPLPETEWLKYRPRD